MAYSHVCIIRQVRENSEHPELEPGCFLVYLLMSDEERLVDLLRVKLHMLEHTFIKTEDTRKKYKMTKECSRKEKCLHPEGFILGLEHFDKNKSSRDGLNNQCKFCRKAYRLEYRDTILQKKKEYYDANKQKILDSNKRWIEKNKDKTKEQRKKYRQQHKLEKYKYDKMYLENNREHIKERNNKYYQVNKKEIRRKIKESYPVNKEQILLQNKKWRAENRDAVNASGAKRRAAKLQRTVAWANLDAIKEVYKDCEEINLAAKTAGCTEKFVVDHEIPLQGELVSGLHIEYNLQIVTHKENCSKHNNFEPLTGVIKLT